MSARRLLARSPWIISAAWLVFLAFPVGGILADSELSGTVKAISVSIIAVFAGVYVDGFRAGFGGLDRLPSDQHHEPNARVAARYLAALVVMAAALFALVGPGAMGVVPFLAAFIGFHFRWAVAVAGVLVAAVVAGALPVIAGEPELAFLGAIVLGVGMGSVMIRLEERRAAQHSESAARLALVEERNRMARDVHDVLGHSLTVVVLKADLSRQLLAKARPADSQSADHISQVKEQLDELATVTRRALAEIRSTAASFRAPDLGDELASAEVVLADAGVRLERRGDIDDVGESRRALLAWAVRESVTNVVRHAGASHCMIELADTGHSVLSGPGEVWLRVSDDGQGPRGSATTGTGLVGLAERAELAGAELRFGDNDGFVLEVVGP